VKRVAALTLNFRVINPRILLQNHFNDCVSHVAAMMPEVTFDHRGVASFVGHNQDTWKHGWIVWQWVGNKSQMKRFLQLEILWDVDECARG
jgi:hypothetical protein